MSTAAESLPEIGWRVGEVLIHTPNAYIGIENWISHFEASFPAMAEKMHKYSVGRNWSSWKHIERWVPVCISWLSKNGERL